MCLTIRPNPGAHCFSFLQIGHFWEAPNSTPHHDFVLGYLLIPTLRSGGSKCAALFAASGGALFQFLASKAFLERPDQ